MHGHQLHIINWDMSATFELVCHMPESSGCYADIDEAGKEVGRLEFCNLVEWFQNVGDEMIDGELKGPPPWHVFGDWSNGDYPVLVQHTGNATYEGNQNHD